MPGTRTEAQTDLLRAAIRNTRRVDETLCLRERLQQARLLTGCLFLPDRTAFKSGPNSSAGRDRREPDRKRVVHIICTPLRNGMNMHSLNTAAVGGISGLLSLPED
jgi:hypothetical protein